MKKLTDIQFRCLKLLAQGFTYKQIADKENTSLDNVKRRFALLYRKLNARNCVDALRIALLRGFISLKDLKDEDNL